jgi:hypothetical protein
MVSPVHGIMPQSGRKYTYTSCSDCPSQLYSRLSGWLAGSVGEHIRRAKITPQKGPDSDEWRLLKACFPEMLDTKERDLLKSLDALPAWAQNA